MIRQTHRQTVSALEIATERESGNMTLTRSATTAGEITGAQGLGPTPSLEPGARGAAYNSEEDWEGIYPHSVPIFPADITCTQNHCSGGDFT